MIKPILISATLLICLLSSGVCRSEKSNSPLALPHDTVSVTNFGVKSNSFENASPGIVKAIESFKRKENAVLKLPGGRIDLWPEGAVKRELYISNSTEADTLSKVKNIGFWFENFQNFTIDGNHTLVVLHGKMVSFAFLNCRNILLKDISFDYERPTMSELAIKSVSDSVVKTEIHPDSRYSIENGRINFYGEGWKYRAFHTILYDSQKDIMRYSSFQPFLKGKAIQTAPFRVTFEGDFSKTNFKPGDMLSIRDPYRDNCGGFINLSKDVRLENVNMYYMHGLGIVSQFSENIKLKKVEVAPRKGSGRIIASFADCFHFSGCRGIVEIDSCLMSGAHDDPINIHGTHLQITGIDARGKMTVRFMHHQTYGFQAFFPGDSIAFVVPQTLKPSAIARVKNARLINLRDMELEIEGALPESVKTGLCIENLSWTPEVIIRNSRFERTNTRGLLVTTRRKVLIENNTFYHTGMHAILIADDASSWFESGRVMDVTIRNNVFEDCGYKSAPGNYIIAIAPENHELVPGFYVHRNIRIENNTFKMYDDPVLTARSVDHLVFKGNELIRDQFMPKGDFRPGFKLTSCTNVEIRDNKFSAGWNSTVSADQMKQKDIKTNLPITFNQ
jgi:hypothetical protein